MAASLALSGALTGFLVYRLDEQNARDQLARAALAYRTQVQRAECANTACTVRVQDEPAFLAQVGERVSGLGDDRLLLLSRAQRVRGVTLPPRVIYDSGGGGALGTPLRIGSQVRRIAGEPVSEGQTRLEGEPYLVAATPVSGRFTGTIVLAQPVAAVSAKERSDLAPVLFWSVGAGLLLAIIVALVLSRALTRPLKELEHAAEDVAAGNYSRRVAAGGGDEIAVVGRAFNRMAEAVERSRSLQRDFLANVSHELKTPLTSLIGFSQALMDGSLGTDQQKARAATILHEEAERVLRMSQELLDLARVEAGQVTFRSQPVDLGAQLQQELEIVRPRAQARDLALHLDLPPSLPPVLADPERLHQVLENLLDNAVKYAPQGSQVGIAAVPGPGRLLIEVTNLVVDPRPDPERMFDRFYRADPSRSSAAGGAGLGLAISRELALAQGGSLTAALDQPDRLRMRLELPAVAEAGPLPEAAARPALRFDLPPPAAGP